MINSNECKERLLRDFNNGLLPYFETTDIDKISTLLMMALADYRLDKETREVAILDDYNDKILNTYSNCLCIEGKSDKTVAAYRRELRKLGDTLHKNYCDMGTYDLRYYLAVMKARNVTNTTLENSRAYMSAFFKWMEIEGFVDKNPMAPIKPIRTNPKQETPFLGSEIDALRFACRSLMERALIETALSSGLRCSELAALRISDINLKTMEVRVLHGKGDKERTSYVNELALKCIERYLADRTDSDDILFRSRANGGSFYTGNGLYSAIRSIGKRANVTNVHPHRFRHTMASRLAEKGMPVHEVQQLLGHTNLNTTMRYVHTTKATVKSTYTRLYG